MASEINFNLGEAGGSDRNMEKLVASAASIADAQAIQASIERRLASPAAQLTTGFIRTSEVSNKFVDPNTGAAFKLSSRLTQGGAAGGGPAAGGGGGLIEKAALFAGRFVLSKLGKGTVAPALAVLDEFVGEMAQSVQGAFRARTADLFGLSRRGPILSIPPSFISASRTGGSFGDPRIREEDLPGARVRRNLAEVINAVSSGTKFLGQAMSTAGFGLGVKGIRSPAGGQAAQPTTQPPTTLPTAQQTVRDDPNSSLFDTPSGTASGDPAPSDPTTGIRFKSLDELNTYFGGLPQRTMDFFRDRFTERELESPPLIQPTYWPSIMPYVE